MILDLHVHSRFSGDSPVSPEEYARRGLALQQDHLFDGFALMEHNYWVRPADCDLARLAEETGLTILAGAEIDTYWGHLLVYGMTDRLWAGIQANGGRKQEPVSFAELALKEGAVIVPAHPFRFYIGMGNRGVDLDGVRVIEGLNGSNTEVENLAALDLAKKQGWAVTGGSDAHFPLELGKALTRFERPIKTMADLVVELKAGRCSAIPLEAVKRTS